MKFSVYSAMTLGGRSIQEDCIMDGVDRWQDEEFEFKREMTADSMLFAVCDGMGGHDKGDEASRFVCEELKNLSHEDITDGAKLSDILTAIQESALNKLPANCGTTVAGLLAMGSKVIVFNAGDSRVYRVLPEELKYISHDHSLVQEMVDKELIPSHAAIDHPLKNLIEFGLGPIFEDAWAQYQIHLFEEALSNGASYLLCTDGLTGAMRDSQILECLMESPEDKGQRLLYSIRRKRLSDNTSFILLDIHHD
jgi:serine/threonine protein phosphatase PrpC